MKISTTRLVLSTAIVVLTIGAPGRTKADVTVTPSNLDGWSTRVTDMNGALGGNSTGIAQFVTGPATPPLGVGSVQLATGNGTIGGDGSAQMDNTNYQGTLLSSITSLSYSTYVTANNGQQFPYLNLVVSTDGSFSSASLDKLYFEPPFQTPTSGNPSLPNQGASVLNTWQTWNALSGGWYSDSGYGSPGTGVLSLGGYEAANPNATIWNSSSALAGIRLNVGFASATDVFNGYVDNFTIGINGTNTTYDFEPAPEPSTMLIAGLGALGFVVYAARRRRASA
jgi:MYXO-CTERM domain-containing protein